MKIIVDNSTFYNVGDIAMLQVAVSRLYNLRPNTQVEVITSSPDLLTKYFPYARPLSARGKMICSNGLFGGIEKCVPKSVFLKLLKMDNKLRTNRPELMSSLLQFKRKLQLRETEEVRVFFKSFLQADLVVLTGGGDFSDIFEHYSCAFSILDIIEMAIRRGIPTAMLSQGFGPFTKSYSSLYDRAKEVIPSIDLLFVREKKYGPAILKSLGVAPNKIIVTGDDAIELAYAARVKSFGNGIGINLRIAFYSGIEMSMIEIVREVLHDAARAYSAPLIPVPISISEGEIDSEGESDIRSIGKIISGYGEETEAGKDLKTPLEVIQQLRKCRIVVTGAYHGAVFALSQGIPAICLVKSKYYIYKFTGLADQFGLGCEVIYLDDEQLPIKLSLAIDKVWKSAEQLRPELLEAAKQQIEKGHAAYHKLYELVAHRKIE